METFLKIENIKLWARVGVLDEERELGQLFILDIFLWTDFEKCTINDDIKKTVDYSKLVHKRISKLNNCPNSLSSSRTPTLAQSLIFSIFKKVSIFKSFKDLYVYR